MSIVDNPHSTKSWATPLADEPGLSGRIADSLRRAILDGSVAAGEKVNEEGLARAFATSRTPVREALRLLEAEGLVSVISRRGAWVSPLLPEDAADTYICRAHFYGLAARLGAQRRTEADLNRLRTLMSELVKTIEAQDPRAYLAVMAGLNDAIVSASGSPQIRTALRPLDLKAIRYRHISIMLPDRMSQSHVNYGRIVAAIEAQSPATAEQAARHAVAEAGEALLTHIMPNAGLTVQGVF